MRKKKWRLESRHVKGDHMATYGEGSYVAFLRLISQFNPGSMRYRISRTL